MADKKISQLTAASTPLAGTEVLPIVQSNSTVKVSVANLTAGRVLSALGADITGVGSKLTFDTTGIPAANYIYTTNSFNLTLYAGRGSTVQIDLTTDYVDSYIGGVRQTRLSTTGLTLDTGNLIQGTAAKGVNFTANTPAAGMTSQLLNWYEEGTWTPADASGAGLSFTGLSGNCYYTRVGNVVTLIFNITYPTTTNISSTSVSGLPFTSKNTTNSVAGGHLSYTNAGKEISCIVVNNATSFSMYDNAGNTIKNNELSEKIIRGSLVYLV